MKEQKSLGNKGFSLVELIVVIAIMAILVAVLAPTLISKIEDSREGTDYSTLGEIKTAIEEAIVGNETIYNNVVKTGGTELKIEQNGTITSVTTGVTITELQDEFNEVIGSFSFKSKKAKDGGYVQIKISEKGKVTATIMDSTGAAIDTVDPVGETATTKTTP